MWDDRKKNQCPEQHFNNFRFFFNFLFPYTQFPMAQFNLNYSIELTLHRFDLKKNVQKKRVRICFQQKKGDNKSIYMNQLMGNLGELFLYKVHSECKWYNQQAVAGMGLHVRKRDLQMFHSFSIRRNFYTHFCMIRPA